ncbi:hypothetical protein A7J50_1179 [Pseudomonas antarctica]|uniref:Uncharacterized protein n=1 Tax=Pseudomonas antarctica TaxID=219572 RepID=A0A172YX28_9PSED|nr:hypothetical protein [Pseudomonas antarctica]ANF84618.1 hypothetical protein A7J50_1179 [Pseudomonas antarctica]
MIKNSPVVASLTMEIAAIIRQHLNVPEPTAKGGDLVSLVQAYWHIHNLIDAPEDQPRIKRHPLNQGQLIDLERVSLTIYRQIMALTGLSFYPAWQICVSAVRIEAAEELLDSEIGELEIARLKKWVDDLSFKDQIIAERWMVEEGATA